VLYRNMVNLREPVTPGGFIPGVTIELTAGGSMPGNCVCFEFCLIWWELAGSNYRTPSNFANMRSPQLEHSRPHA